MRWEHSGVTVVGVVFSLPIRVTRSFLRARMHSNGQVESALMITFDSLGLRMSMGVQVNLIGIFGSYSNSSSAPRCLRVPIELHSIISMKFGVETIICSTKGPGSIEKGLAEFSKPWRQTIFERGLRKVFPSCERL